MVFMKQFHVNFKKKIIMIPNLYIYISKELDFGGRESFKATCFVIANFKPMKITKFKCKKLNKLYMN